MRLQPPLRLDLCGVAGTRRPLREKDDFPAVRGRHGGQLRHRARLDLLEVRPEIRCLLNAQPELTLLAIGQSAARRRRGLRAIAGRGGRRVRSLALDTLRSPAQVDAGAEQTLGFELECRIHVRQCAVEINGNAQRHWVDPGYVAGGREAPD